MKENKYDDESFFKKYSEMDRSKQGLKGAGEWYELQKVLPEFSGKRVLDLGLSLIHIYYSRAAD